MTRTILFITPDYMSHFNPLLPIGEAFRRAGYAIVFGTGPVLKRKTDVLGFKHVDLVLGEESNAGLISFDRRVAIQRSLNATRRGWCEALEEQASRRINDLLWRGDEVADRTRGIIEEYRPLCVVAVQLTFAATAALLALDVPFATLVTGHPTQLPAVGEIYGFPHQVPSVFRTKPSEVRRLRHVCESVQDECTTAFNRLLHRINPRAQALANGLAAASPHLVLFNYPPGLMPGRQYELPARVAFLGASVRDERLEPELQRWLNQVGRGLATVYFSFGSYFSVHTDILRRVAAALRAERVRVLFASGLTAPRDLQPLPGDWLIRPYFPQVALLPHCDLVVCHGGNNTVTEAFAAGVPVVVAPFASDQFGSATSVEHNELGAVFDPNNAPVDSIRAAIRDGLRARSRAATLGGAVRAIGGPDLAVQLCEEVFGLCRRYSCHESNPRHPDCPPTPDEQ